MAVCEQCGEEFQAKRSDAKTCSATCRTRAKRSAPESASTGIVAATELELKRLAALDTFDGQHLMTLATRMASGKETGAAVASLSRELSRVMQVVRATSTHTEDEVEKARRRRDEKRAAASA